MKNLYRTRKIYVITILLIAALIVSFAHTPHKNGKALSAKARAEFKVTVINNLKKADIVKELKKYPHHGFDIDYEAKFVKKDKLTPPYNMDSIGQLSPETLNDALNTLKATRYLAGVSNDGLTLRDDINKRAQAWSIVNILYENIEHTHPKPPGMTDEMYDLAKQSEGGECLSSGPVVSPSFSIRGLVDDTYNRAPGSVGHRMSLFSPLKPDYNAFGVGYSEIKDFAVTCVKNVCSSYDSTSITEQKGDYLWPNSGDFPIEYIAEGEQAYDGNNPYSVYWSADIVDDAFWAKMNSPFTLRYPHNHKSNNFSVKVNGKAVKVEVDDFFHTFKPKSLIKAGDEVEVKVDLYAATYDPINDEKGIAHAAYYTYKVKFFSLKDALGDSFIGPSDEDDSGGRNDGKDDGKDDPAASDKVSIAKADVTLPSNIEYSGNIIAPSVKVQLGGKTLKKDTDYTVSYTNNKEVGAATVTASGKGKYKGSVKKQFRIVPQQVTGISANAGKKKLTVKWKKLSSAQVSRYQIRYKVNGTKTWKYKKVSASKASVVLKKLKKGKLYEAGVRAYKNGNYGDWSKTIKSKKIK